MSVVVIIEEKRQEQVAAYETSSLWLRFRRKEPILQGEKNSLAGNGDPTRPFSCVGSIARQIEET
jgi:hypothetical protein